MKWRLRQWARIPFSLALDDSRSVLAVKGSLRRFAPWTAAGRSEGMAVYEGKGGGWAWLLGCGPCERAGREPFGPTGRLEPQPRGAVTRRAVAQRRSRASGLTRLLAEAISGVLFSGFIPSRDGFDFGFLIR